MTAIGQASPEMEPSVSSAPRRLMVALPLGVTCLGLGLTAVLLWQDVRFQRSEQDRREDQALVQASQAIQAKLSATSQILYGVVGLFDSSAPVSREQFTTYYESLKLSDTTIKGIQGVGFTQAIRPGEKASYEAAIRASGFPTFAVNPSGTRSFYSSITFLEPFDWRNRRAFGFDMWSNPIRRQAMARARDTGLPSLSGRVTLVQETSTDVQTGTLLYLPIYRQKQPLVTIADRRSALLGWAYSPLRMRDLIRAALDDPLVDFPRSADVQVFDTSPSRSTLLYDSRIPEHRDPQVLEGRQRRLPIYRRSWLLRVALPTARGTFDLQSVLLTLCGVLTSIGLGMGTGGLVRQHRRTLANLRALESAHQARRLSAAVISSLDEGLMITDPNAVIQQINPAFTRITGYSETEALGRPAAGLQSGVQGQEFFARLWSDLSRYGSWQGEFWNRHRNGQLYRQSLSITSVRDEKGDPRHYIGVIRDVTREYKEQEEVRHQAQHDYLTGLPNRSLLVERLEQALKQATRKGASLALLFLDLNRFKPINDQYGHLAGDGILQALGQRLREAMRATDTVARFGGDEFVVLVPDLESQDGVLTLASKLRELVDTPFHWEGVQLQIGVSIGIALYPDHGHSADALLAAADTAMYVAKQEGEGAVVVFSPTGN